jgi:hypothetical protein
MLKTVSSFINNIGALVYRGTWDAATNNPTLASGVGTKGDYYVVNVAGSTDLDGITDWEIGDWAIFNGAAWQKVDNTDSVVSVNGQTGVVVLNAVNVGATPNTTLVLTSGLLTGGGELNANVTVDLTTVPVANVPGAVPNTVNVLGGGLLTGGGPLTGNVTIGLTSVPVANVPGAVPNTVYVLGGGLLTGGGALTGNVTIDLTTVPFANVTGAGTMASQNANSVNITGGNVTANLTSGNVNLTSNTAATATFADPSLPLAPEGYITVKIAGVDKKIPYYGV